MENIEKLMIRANMDTSNLSDLQYGVLGYIMTHRNTLGPAMARLTEDLFDGVPHVLYTAANKLFLAGHPVDPVTVQKEAGVGSEAGVKKALDLAPTEVDYYIDLLIEYNKLWQIQIAAREILASGSLEEAETHISEINRLTSSRPNIDTASDLELLKRYLTRKYANEPPPEYIRFGIPALDDALFVRPGDLVVLGGYSSAGKTLLSIQFAREMRKKYRVGYFSLETDNEKMNERLISHAAHVDFRSIKTGTETPADLSSVESLGVALGDDKGSLVYHHATGLSVRDIQAITLSRRYQIIFVDYLQTVNTTGRDFRERVSNVSMSLHAMAQTHGVTVIALAQLVRPEKSKNGTAPPNMWSFKESGQIENDADVAMLLYPENMDDNGSQRILKVTKNKDGGKINLRLNFDGAHQTLTPAPPSKAEIHGAIAAAAKEARRQRAAQDDGQVKLEDLPGEDPDVPF